MADVTTSSSAYVEGNIATSGSQAAYITGLQGTTSNSKHGYIAGIERSSQSAYVEGVYMTVDYITFETSDSSLSKKFRVLQQDYDDGTLERSEQLSKTIGGGVDHAMGAIYKTWSMIIRVRHTEDVDGYGDLEDLEYFYSLNNPNGTPSNDITFTDHHLVEYTVHMVGKLTKNLMGTEIVGLQAWYLYKVSLMRVQ